MHEALRTYFEGEKNAGLLAALFGLVALATAALLWSPRWGVRSLATTLGVIGLLLVAVGVGLYLKTGPQVERLVAELGSDPAAYAAAEGARMARVQRNFVYLEYLWIALVTSTSVAAVALKERPGPSGVALGLLLAAAFVLCFDLAAERRGQSYLDAVTASAGR